MAEYYDTVTKTVTNYPPGVVPLMGIPVIQSNVPPGPGAPITSNVPVQPRKNNDKDEWKWWLGAAVFVFVLWRLLKR